MGLLIINPANDSFVTDMIVGVAFGVSVANCDVAGADFEDRSLGDQ